MKLTRTAWLILGIGIFVIAAGTLSWVYFQQKDEQERLDENLLLENSTLSALVSQKGNLESQLTQLESELAEAESLLDEAEAKFPESVESIEYDEILFGIADDWGLEITSLTASEPSDEEVDDVTYSVTSFEVVVRGEVPDILDFIGTIATSDDFTTATVELVDMEVPCPGEEEKPSATINLVIYSYEGE